MDKNSGRGRPGSTNDPGLPLFAFLAAAVVLAPTGRKYLRAAATQGAAPLLAVVLGLIALAV